jgi:hypothetical protein
MPFQTTNPRLFAASMFQVYPHDRGQNYSVELARRVVDVMERQPIEPALEPPVIPDIAA